jgi:hypothetical protein
MDNAYKHNYQSLVSKWLLAVVLIISFFISSTSTSRQQLNFSAQQTELVNTGKNHLARSITFARALKQMGGNLFGMPVFATQIPNLAQIHSLAAKTELASLRHQNNLRPTLFYIRKTIPGNNSDEPAIALV